MPPLAAAFVALLCIAPAIVSAQSGSLRIVVVAGEDAVNIIQQKTAVAPVVEVRDRNNLPVSGVAVTFSVGGQGASFGGLSTLTVTTNAAGQAAAVGLTPTAAGAIQINATALVQGQALTATITQTNVLTAAQAAAAAGATGGTSGASGSAGGAAGSAGGGGGLSATTIGILGAAVGGGALAATQLAGNEEPEGDTRREFAGTFSGQLNWAFTGCTRIHEMSGTLTIELDSLNGPFTGTAHIQGTSRVIGFTGAQCGGGPQVGATDPLGITPSPLAGASNIAFIKTESNTVAATANMPAGVHTVTFSFTGNLSGDTITGTLTHTELANGGGTGTATYPVTLRPN
jgi:fibronectin-binding autotransporter adhesin